ncbi:MAG: hypothetical protein IPM58_04665 [Nitrospira sp.]|nr:hypothetical protein [Nitrospira sp.]
MLARRGGREPPQAIDRAAGPDRYLRGKFTNQQLYVWMSGQLSALHYQAYQLALDMARKAGGAVRTRHGRRTADREPEAFRRHLSMSAPAKLPASARALLGAHARLGVQSFLAAYDGLAVGLAGNGMPSLPRGCLLIRLRAASVGGVSSASSGLCRRAGLLDSARAAGRTPIIASRTSLVIVHRTPSVACERARMDLPFWTACRRLVNHRTSRLEWKTQTGS